ncbi:MAG: hypothetical protein ACK5OC_05290, partial [Pirellula sp.]
VTVDSSDDGCDAIGEAFAEASSADFLAFLSGSGEKGFSPFVTSLEFMAMLEFNRNANAAAARATNEIKMAASPR